MMLSYGIGPVQWQTIEFAITKDISFGYVKLRVSFVWKYIKNLDWVSILFLLY